MLLDQDLTGSSLLNLDPEDCYHRPCNGAKDSAATDIGLVLN